jgi:ribonucleoside-triphosphate reductase
MRTVAEIDADIAKVKAELQDVHGTTTEVYARIVGYYRSVRNWNRGKREEYNHRKLFVADEGRVNEHLPVSGCGCEAAPSITVNVEAAHSVATGSIDRYELFVRRTCPNCPPVKECCANLPLSGEQVDVDSAEGFARASANEIFSTPTVVFFDADDREVARAYSVKEIRAIPALARVQAPALF